MRWVIIAVVSLAVIVIVVVAIGYALPQQHTASRTVFIDQPPEPIWEAITNVARMPEWRPEVQSVNTVAAKPGVKSWTEKGKHGAITFEVAESQPPRKLVTRIADKNLPFGGSWTQLLEPRPGGTELTVREDGEVYNPVFRFVSRFVIGHYASIDAYIAALKKHLGSKVGGTHQ